MTKSLLLRESIAFVKDIYPAKGDLDLFPCENSGLTAGLNQYLTIQRARWEKGTSGDAVATWCDERTVLAAVQPVRSERKVCHGAELLEATHRVFLAEQVSLDEDCRVVAPDGRNFRIVTLEKAERIGELAVAQVIEEPAT